MKVNGDQATAAREHNERISHQAEVLRILRSGICLTDVRWRRTHPGSRLAATIEKLRNAYGFTILGTGSFDNGYHLKNCSQRPRMIEATDLIKNAYYATLHWATVREQRQSLDSYLCVICTEPNPIDQVVCHHIRYRLFAEELNDLMTVCDHHHQMIHSNSIIRFPHGVTENQCDRMGIPFDIPEWQK